MKSDKLENYINTPLPIKKELLRFFNTADKLIIFDIGSCEAEDSIRYSLLFPNSKIHAFEPVPENVIKAKLNINKWNRINIETNQIALSNEEGIAKLNLSEGQPENVDPNGEWNYGNKSSSLLKPDLINKTHSWLKFEKTIEIETTTIDKYCLTHNIEKIDFMHIDVQGGELMVLEGASGVLSSISMIWMEVENITLYKDQPLKKDIETSLTKNGFKKIKDTVNDISGDQLYANYKHFKLGVLDQIKYNISNIFQNP